MPAPDADRSENAPPRAVIAFRGGSTIEITARYAPPPEAVLWCATLGGRSAWPSPAREAVIDTGNDLGAATPRRVRSAFDGLRLTGGVALILVLAGVGTWGNETSAGLNADLVRAVDALPGLITNSLQALGGIASLSGPTVAVVVLLLHGQFRQLVEGLLVGVLAVVVTTFVALALSRIDGTALYQSLTLVSARTRTPPLDAYLAGWVALLIFTGVALNRLTRGLMIAAFALYVASALGAALESALSLACSVALGAVIGLGVRYLTGTLDERLTVAELATDLRSQGVDLVSFQRTPSTSTHRTYRAVGRNERTYDLSVLDRDSVASGWVVRIYRWIRLQADVTASPALSTARIAERRTLLGLAAESSGARLPHLVGEYDCGDRTIVIVYEHIVATAFDDLGRELSDAEVIDLWHNAELLHAKDISHPRLTPNRLRVAVDGGVVLPILDETSGIAERVRLDLDRAQILISTALAVGADHAVALAREVLDEERLRSTAAALQPIALPREIRRSLRAHKTLLEQLRTALGSKEPDAVAAIPSLERVRPRTVVALVGLIIAAWLLVGQLGSVNLSAVLREAKWRWVPLLLVASALTYVAAAVSLTGYVRERLSLVRTTVVQLASSFAGFVLPPALGPVAVNVRYLQQAGLSTAAAAAAVGTSQVVNGISHALLLAAVAALTGRATDSGLAVPLWAFLVLAGLVVVLLAALAVPIIRHWLVVRVTAIVHDVGPRMLDLVTRPWKLAQAVGGAVALNVAYIAALWFAVRAFNGDVAPLTVAVVYLAGAAVGSLAPTPGGMGAIEVALSTGLATAGMPSAAAVSAVLLYRLGTFWLPVPVGWLALHRLQRAHLL